MNLVEVTQSDKTEYNDFVSVNENGSFLQSYEWGQWQGKVHREVRRFFWKDGERILASAQFIKMLLPFGRFYWYAPYGPVFAQDLKQTGYVSGYTEFLTELAKKFSGAVFFRIEPKTFYTVGDESALVKSTNIQPVKTLLLDLEESEEDILKKMHEKTRYNIRLAKKKGVEVQSELVVTPGKGLYIKDVVRLILETQVRQKFRGHTESYYESMMDFFALTNPSGEFKLRLYKALFEKELLASAFVLDFGSTRTYIFGGSSENKKNLMAPYALHWQAILDAKNLGFKYYDFWGTETSAGYSAGFARFKQGFGGRTVEYFGAYDWPLNRVIYTIYKFFRKVRRLLK